MVVALSLVNLVLGVIVGCLITLIIHPISKHYEMLRRIVVMYDSVVLAVISERLRQDDKWGEQNHPDGTGDPEAVAEAERLKKACDDAFNSGNPSWRVILEEEVAEALAETDPVKLKEELTQTAAVCISWIEAINRRQRGKKD